MGVGTGAVMGLPKALTGSIVMARDSANGVLTFVEIQKKKKTPQHNLDVSPVCTRAGAVFKCVKSVRRARTSFKLLRALRFHTDFT